MPQTIEDLFNEGFERYRAGEKAETLIPIFEEIGDRAPNNAAGWTSLSWLYLIAEQPQAALKAAKKAVKCDRQAVQPRINLALAMLETNTKGVRQHIDLVLQTLALEPERRENIDKNIADGLVRRPNWEALERVQDWLE